MTAHPVPWGVLDQHVAFLAKTRSGKSSAMRTFVEHLLDQKKPVCIIDPKGDWWGIKIAADGKGPGYPLVVFGGQHADVPINAHAGAHVAELFATGNRPCLVDLGGWTVGDRTRFWIDFASTLFMRTVGQRWLVVDEVHNFVPKGKIMDPDAGKALHWGNRLGSEGLGKGLALLFASQRPQKVHNDLLTSAETLIAMRVLHPSDRAAVADWIDGCGDPRLGKEVLESLAQLERGEAWAWSPEIKFGPKRVQFPLFKTYDSFRAQTATDVKSVKGWAEVDLDEVKAKLAIVVKESEDNDPKRLKARVAELQRELVAEKKKKIPAQGKVDPAAIKEERDKAYTRGKIDGYGDAIKGLAPIGRDLARAAAESGRMSQSLSELAGRIDQWANRKPTGPTPAAAPREIDAPAREAPRRAVAHRPERPQGNGHAVGEAIPKGEKAILVAAAARDRGATLEFLTVVTGYKRSSRNTYIQRLSERGFIERQGDRIVATGDGIEALGSDYEPMPAGDELRQFHLERLPEGERRILQILIERYPDAIDRDDLDESTGYKRSSRNTYIQRLSARELVETAGAGAVKAAGELFDGET